MVMGQEEKETPTLPQLVEKYGDKAVTEAIEAMTMKKKEAYTETQALNDAFRKEREEAPHRPKAGLAYSPPAGMVWNPMKRYNGNDPCLCGSGKKYKKCHRPSMADCVTPEEAKSISARIKEVLG